MDLSAVFRYQHGAIRRAKQNVGVGRTASEPDTRRDLNDLIAPPDGGVDRECNPITDHIDRWSRNPEQQDELVATNASGYVGRT